MRKGPIALSELHRLLEVRPDTGELFWRVDRTSKTRAGDEAFTAKRPSGRRVGMVSRVLLRRARVVFAMCHGYWPEGLVDHINGDPSDDRIENLRDVSAQQNAANCARNRRAGYSKYVGVTFDKRGSGHWRGQVSKDNKNFSTKNFRCETAAAVARDQLAKELHGSYSRLNVNAKP